MDLRLIIEEIASEADDFLAGATSREQARAGIAELLNADYFHLAPADGQKVIEGVMAILDYEDFFGTEFAGGAFDEETEA
jgi:hypothetical protein